MWCLLFGHFQFANLFDWIRRISDTYYSIIFSLWTHLIELREDVTVRTFSVFKFTWLNYRKKWCMVFDHFQFPNSFDSIRGRNYTFCSIIFNSKIHLIEFREELMPTVRSFSVCNSFDWTRGKSYACCSIIFSFQIHLIQL